MGAIAGPSVNLNETVSGAFEALDLSPRIAAYPDRECLLDFSDFKQHGHVSSRLISDFRFHSQ